MRPGETIEVRNSRQFLAVCEMVLRRGLKVRFRARGESMQPNILDGDTVEIIPLSSGDLGPGDVAFTRGKNGLLLHRVIGRDPGTNAVMTRGDAGQQRDVPADAVLGKVVAIERGGERVSFAGRNAAMVHALRTQLRRLVRAVALRRLRLRAALVPIVVLFACFLAAPSVVAQAYTITNTASPTTVAPGGTITYTQVLTNNSGVTITPNSTVSETVPAGTTYVSMAKTAGHGTWTCNNAGGTVTCTDTANYTTGNTTTFTFTVTVNAATPNGTVVTDTVSAQGNNTGTPVSASANVTVETPDLSVTGTALPNPVATGGTITYTETVTNNSTTVAAMGATLTQSTPANTLFSSITPPAGWTCGTVPPAGGTGSIICTANGNFNANTSVNFTVVVTVKVEATGGSTISNTVTVSETGTDPNPANNTVTLSVTVSGADLSMTQVASASAVAPGTTITYTETVTNNGPGAATGAVLYQQTPPNTTFSSITLPAGWACGTTPAVGGTGQVICTAGGNLNANTTTGSFTFVVTVAAATTAGTTIINSADVTSQTTDPVPSNNATTTSVLVEIAGEADLAVSITASPTPVFVSSPLSYTIRIQNLGLASAAAVQVIDTLPAALAGALASTTQGSCGAPSGGAITCTLGTVAYPLTSPITITVSGTTPGTATTLTNTVKVSSATTDPVAANNTATVLTVVQPLVCATPGRDGAGASLSGVVNAYYPPGAGVATVTAGSTSITLGAAAASGAQTPIAAGDLVLVIQIQGAQINSTNTSSYGSGVAGDPAGSTSLGSSGEFEFVTATNATPLPVTGGTLTFTGSGSGGGLLNTYTNAAATSSEGVQTFQVIRVPQYSSATLSSNLTAMAWNGATGGVLALDIASQLTLGGTVVLDGFGFRGGGGIDLRGAASGANTDTVTDSPAALPALPPPTGSGANGSKGEGIAGTPHWVAPTVSAITHATTATSTNQTYLEGLPNGSFARGAPGNAAGGATDADPPANDQNSGGGGGANGGTGGTGGFGWNSAGVVGGFGGIAFPASTSALVMGGGGGAGTTNNGSYWDASTDTGNHDCGATCTGIYSSGVAGGGIVILRAGSVVGTGTISSNGQTALAPENDGGGGGGAGGTILVFANTGGLGGLTANAAGGNGGNTWPEQAPGATYPGNRHGPGGGGGGGVVMTTSAPGSVNVSGGSPGWSTLADDAYGATPGQPGVLSSGLILTQTPGTQSGAYCTGADLAVTNSGTPNPVTPGGTITYTQGVSNNGPLDGLNAVFTEAVPANTVFESLGISGPAAASWNCTTPGIGASGNISCTNPDIPAGASGAATFTVVVQVNLGAVSGTQITDTDSITSGTNDPNLANNTATVVTIVAASGTADLVITNAASPNPVLAGNNITYTVVVTNAGPSSASAVVFSETIPTNTTLVSVTPTSGTTGWTCTPGAISCSIPTFAAGASTTFTVVVKVNAGTASGTLITDTANVSSATTDPDPPNSTATVTVVVATAGQADLAVTKTGTPNPVLAGNKMTYTVVVTNNGPAAAANVTLTDTIPANTTVTSISAPSGWTCNPPSGGTFTCTNPSVAANTSGTFTFVVTVTAGTAPGTTITNSVNVSSLTTTDPNSANNTASTSSTVASPSEADVAILKTASPEPVDQGTNLTYTLEVTNNGPAVAQNVVVTDPLPSQVSYASSSTTAGSCTETGTTVTCNLGSISVGGLVVITINVNATTFSSSQLVSNTATVTSSTPDPNLSNNTSTAISTIQSPTAVQMVSLRAMAQAGGSVVIEWQTREEVHNLGFHVYREDVEGQHRLDPSLIAGSALLLSGGLPQHRAKTYQWLDGQARAGASYWVEDVDLNGTRTMHGPISVDSSGETGSLVASAGLLKNLNQASTAGPILAGRTLLAPPPPIPGVLPGTAPASLNEGPAVKISVTSEGWYHVSRAQLVEAGLDPNVDARDLQLYAEGVEQPIGILGRESGPLGPNDSIEFYGTGIDTPFSDTRVYWLIRGSRPGKRVTLIPSGGSGAASATSFPATLLFSQRTTYFAALLNGENNDNFFGAIVSTEPVDQSFPVLEIDHDSSMPVTLDVTLQGVTNEQAHQVAVSFNGAPIGEIDFANQANVTNTLAVSSSLLVEGTNTVTLTALDGDSDLSLVGSIALHYPHTYTADGNWLHATAPSGELLHIHGFTNSKIRVLDVTDPTAISQLVAPVSFDGSSFAVTVLIPGASGASRTLLAFSDDQISPPTGLAFHRPNSIDKPGAGAEMVVITHPDFLSSVAPLVELHRSQGTSVAVVTTDEVFDAFNFGERSPFAIQSYLGLAATTWRVAPQAVLLVGRASFDPRNYLGFGYLDFVPSRMIETAAFKTASDDWLTDFQQTGLATLPTGRLPVDSPADAVRVVSKIVGYESGATAGSWQQQALVIADQNIGVDFTAEANSLVADMPASLGVTKILADGRDPAAVEQQILAGLNAGALIVNYTGHGSEQQWSFSDLLDDTTATALANGDRLPVYLLMDCLNGYFQDVYATSLSTSLMLAPKGGAVAVWASSGFTDSAPQATMNQALLTMLASNPSIPLGKAILSAKTGITDPDVRRTWILFGDPAMRLPIPAVTAASSKR